MLIADDDSAVRAAVRRALEEDPRFTICTEAADASSCVEAAVRERPDVCLLDIRMPPNGIAAAREIVARLPQTKVVMFTVSTDDDDLFAAIVAGASGYLLKSTEPWMLADALADVVNGRAAVAPELVIRIIEQFRDTGPRRRAVGLQGPAANLTSREWEVLELLRRNLSTSQIGDRLFISAATVRSHVAAIVRKLHVPDRDAAVRLFDDA